MLCQKDQNRLDKRPLLVHSNTNAEIANGNEWVGRNLYSSKRPVEVVLRPAAKRPPTVADKRELESRR